MQNQGMNIQIKLYAYLNKYDTRLTEEKLRLRKPLENYILAASMLIIKNNTEVTFIFIIYR